MGRPQHVGDSRELLIGEIYKSMLGATPISGALRELARVTHSDKAIWAYFDFEKQGGEITDCFNCDPQFVQRHNAVYSAQNVWLAKQQYFQTEGLIWRGSRIVPVVDMVKTSYYQELLAPQQIYHTLHIVVRVEAEQIFHVMLTRRPYEPDYEDAEIELARCFAHHARKASDSMQLVSRLRMVQTGLSGVADDAALGVAILDPPAIVYASETCERILASLGAPITPRNDEAAANGGQSAPRFYFPRIVAAAISKHDFETTTRLIIDRRDREGRLLVDIKPFPFRGLSPLDRRVGLAVIFLDLDQRILVDEELLQNAYSLTASEARVCSLLANGENVEDVSEKLNISSNTARTHIKRIFGKTGSSRQAELVRLLMSTARLRRSGRRVGANDGTKSGLGSLAREALDSRQRAQGSR